MGNTPDFGALVISLDFELYWGVRDFLSTNGDYRKNLAGEHAAIPRMLDMFEEFDIAATWATVGLLFADSEADFVKFRPSVLPQYRDPSLSPYLEDFEQTIIRESVSTSPKVIKTIAGTPRQEIGTHTFSHYYCLEDGQTAESFDADMASAVGIAAEHRIKLESIVFPRNQHNPLYDEILVKHGIICCRGNQTSRMYDFNNKVQFSPVYRATRLADSYVNVSGLNTHAWDEAIRGRLANIPASMFLRPVSREESVLNDLQFRRISRSMEHAARNRRIFHLWWHPHNFGTNTDANIKFLGRILQRFRELRSDRGMRSLSMAEAARVSFETAEVPT